MRHCSIHFYITLLFCLLLFGTQSCDSLESLEDDCIITLNDEQQIGETIHQSLVGYFADNNSRSLLKRANHRRVYGYLDSICLAIQDQKHTNLSSNSGYQATEYNPRSSEERLLLHVFDGANATNAFTLPGRHIYLDKGLLKKLDNEVQLVALLATLIHNSDERYAAEKLQETYSISFMMDLALGGSISDNADHSGVYIGSVYTDLAVTPYKVDQVEAMDQAAEELLCSLDYDIRAYSNFYLAASNQTLEWMSLFPRTLDNNGYATHLFNSYGLGCNGAKKMGRYAEFKQWLD